MIDTPKSLGNLRHRAERLAQINDTHIAELTAFVNCLRNERGCGDKAPYFDPADGGVGAEVLFILEAPGKKAVDSGFISCNNPDETAKNWLELNIQAKIPRKRTIAYNIVPWYIGSDNKIRSANSDDIEQGWPYLVQLLTMLPKLKIIVLIGKKAQRVASRLRVVRPDLRIMDCPHPSPLYVNNKPENRDILLSALRKIATALD